MIYKPQEAVRKTVNILIAHFLIFVLKIFLVFQISSYRMEIINKKLIRRHNGQKSLS